MQVGCAGTAVVAFALLAATGAPLVGFVVAVPCAAAGVRVSGHTLFDLVPLISRLRLRGGRDWFARLPLTGSAAPMPPALRGQVVLAVEGVDHGFFGR